ncbi:hypothetical protein BGP_4671 [Beggiatoa sp. PS]|nr:hypothetical protein BGP_4671 [Beggiatoa sp. PS]
MQPSNILNIESLDEEWTDKDIVLLHACFQLLVNCVEQESLLNGHTDWDYNEEFKRDKQILEELYQWWLERKIQDTNEQIDELNDKQYQKDNEMLIKLISVRHRLWT